MSKPSSDDPLVPPFKSIGLTQAKALEALKAPKSAAILKDIIDANTDKVTGLDEKTATLLSNLSVALGKTAAISPEERDYVVATIVDGKLKSVDQVSGALQVCYSRKTT